MSPRVALIVLGLTSLIFAGFGVAFLLAPAALLATLGIDLGGATGVVEIRAVYGGMNLGLGLYGLAALRKPTQRMPAAQVLALVLATIAAARLLGVLLAPSAVAADIWVFFAMEAVGAAATGIAAGAFVCEQTAA